MNGSCLYHAAFVPLGPPPDRREFAARCREWQRELLWARHDKRSRLRAAETVRQVWNLMAYMAGRRNVPSADILPDQLLKLRPEQAAGEALRALAIAIDWAEGRQDVAR